MDTKKIAALMTALQKGSLTAAAAELGYTQSGLTHMMNSLEDELGIRILSRSKSGVRLSPAGRELLPQLTALNESADELQRAVDGLVRRSFTVLRLGAYSSVARRWVPAILAELRRVSPEIDVAITTGGMRDIYDGIKNDELDCAIVSYQPSLCQGMDYIPLHDDPLFAILPPDFEVSGDSFPTVLFDGREFLMPSDDFELDIMPALAVAGTHISPEYRYTNLDDAAIASMVAHGLGVSILSELVMADIFDDVITRPLSPPACRRLGLVVNGLLRSDKSIKSFVSCARATMKSMYGEG